MGYPVETEPVWATQKGSEKDEMSRWGGLTPVGEAARKEEIERRVSDLHNHYTGGLSVTISWMRYRHSSKQKGQKFFLTLRRQYIYQVWQPIEYIV